jgi:UDP-N-acetylmuramoylalanine--D-glutamate ligase
MEIRGKRVLVVGLARSGREAARCLAARGATVTVTDSRPPSAFQAEIRQLSAQKIGLELGQHRKETFLHQDLIVVSPGVPWDMPHLVTARERGVKVVPEIEAASWYLKGPIVGITGSNGKTTTTALLGKMIKASGFSTFVGGNIGVPLISAVDNTSPDTILVTELSSFQLESIQAFRPHVAVLLNLTPNHLDRHPTFEAYVNAKAHIFRNQTENDWAVLNADDSRVMNLAPTIKSRKVFFSRQRDLPDGVFVSDGHVRYRVANLERMLLETGEVTLRGAFNLENVLAAATAACLMGADFSALRRAVRDFQGVEHRLEFVRTIRGVEFYNDSKATSVDATAKALSAFAHGVHLILGGKDKGAPYAPLRPLLQGRVRDVLLIGASAGRIERELKDVAVMIRAGDLETAVQQAFTRAVPGEVVLLAPACSSFDQFEDFEHRGRVFKKLTSELARAMGMGGDVAKSEIVEPPAPQAANKLHGVGKAHSERALTPETSLDAKTASPVIVPDPAVDLAVKPAAISPAMAPQSNAHASPGGAEPKSDSKMDAPRELTYIYEVDADELPPSDIEASLNETEDGFKPLDAKELGPLEVVDDEVLLFEVPAANRGGRSEGSPRGANAAVKAPTHGEAGEDKG